MSRIAYVNGRYVQHGQAAVHIEDRGYQFGDGVYEVCEVFGGRLIDERRHMTRLNRSLNELRIRWPMTPTALGVVLREVVRRNLVTEGLAYLQITRGVAHRDHAFPVPEVSPALVVTARTIALSVRDDRAARGVSIVTVPDNRWERVDIKTIALLPNVLAKQHAREAGAFEAWFVDKDGFVTEGTSTNAWIVTANGTLVTRPAESGILRGITRSVLINHVTRERLHLEERRFSVSEALEAREAFLTSATANVTPIVKIDGKKIGNGRSGPVATALRVAFRKAAEPAPTWSTTFGEETRSDN